MRKLLLPITLIASLILAGCPSQSAIAALTSILGNSASQIAALEGDTALGQKITTDTAAAVAAVTAWKSGSPAQEAVQALNLLTDDLNLIPGTSKYAPLIALAVGTAESILALLQPPGAVSAHTVSAPKPSAANAKDFKLKWNAIVAANPDLAPAKI